MTRQRVESRRLIARPLRRYLNTLATASLNATECFGSHSTISGT
jgi:hypothetical protein